MADTETKTKGKEDENTYGKVLADFYRAYSWWKPWLNAAREDVEFALGKQWKDEDKQTLEDQARPALTLNKIRPHIFLLSGIESQNRTDFAILPEGDEDSLKAEIATILVKQLVKISEYDYRQSQVFEEGLMCAAGYLEFYPDFTYDLLVGEMRTKKLDYNQVFPAPGFKNYDLSDAPYVCKVTYDLTKDELVSLFPEQEKVIRDLNGGKVNLEAADLGDTERQQPGYQKNEEDTDVGTGGSNNEANFDLVEKYYKKYVPIYFVIDTVQNAVKRVDEVWLPALDVSGTPP